MRSGSSTQSRVAALTGLRGLAASTVVLYHVWLYGGPGAAKFPAGPLWTPLTSLEAGVTFFFVLSGFLLYRPYARALVTDGAWPDLRRFAIARFLRIVPVYWIVVLAVVTLTERELFSRPWRLLANLTFLEFWFPSFLPHNLGTSNGSIAIVPSWSLVVEAAFYVSLPVLGVAAVGFVRRTRRHIAAAFVPPVLLALVGGASVVVESRLHGDWLQVWQSNFPFHAGWFACGMAGTTVWVLWEAERFSLPRRWEWMVGGAALLIAAVALKASGTGVLSPVDTQGLNALAFSLALLLVVLSADARWVRLTLGRPLFVGIGLASYSIFLVHDPIIRAFRDTGAVSDDTTGFLVTLAVVGAATAAATFVSYQLLEKPCFALRRRLTGGPASPQLRGSLERLIAAIDAQRAPDFTIDAPIRVDDPRALEPIVTPLLQNALAYGDAPFAVRASHADGRLRLVVEDAGRGVRADFVPHLFEPYARSEQSSKLPGAGLGLATARRRARELGGDVVYEPGSSPGARFAVVLPLAG
jgi:peptidoglycan/LPS O-acetylase OafA/YrhL